MTSTGPGTSPRSPTRAGASAAWYARAGMAARLTLMPAAMEAVQ